MKINKILLILLIPMLFQQRENSDPPKKTKGDNKFMAYQLACGVQNREKNNGV